MLAEIHCNFIMSEIETAVSKLKLPWANWNWKQIEIAVSEIETAVSKLKLPWANWNCREQIEIAVTLLGHRKLEFRHLLDFWKKWLKWLKGVCT